MKNKKIIFGILGIIIVLLITFMVYFKLKSNSEERENIRREIEEETMKAGVNFFELDKEKEKVEEEPVADEETVRKNLKEKAKEDEVIEELDEMEIEPLTQDKLEILAERPIPWGKLYFTRGEANYILTEILDVGIIDVNATQYRLNMVMEKGKDNKEYISEIYDNHREIFENIYQYSSYSNKNKSFYLVFVNENNEEIMEYDYYNNY